MLIGAPLSDGAVQLTSNCPSPGVSVGAAGLEGLPIGVPRAGADHGLSPTEFCART